MLNIEITLANTIIDSAPLLVSVNNFFVLVLFLGYRTFKYVRKYFGSPRPARG
jgi:hypothetical protein